MAAPRYDQNTAMAAAQAIFHPLKPDSRHRMVIKDAAGSALTHNFNKLWAAAVDAYEAGILDAFAMIHSDVGAEVAWLDKMADELERWNLDMVSATIRLKNMSGLSSTAVDDSGDPWLPRRLTMTEIDKLPPTFTSDDAGGPLLLNTGLWLCKLGPWCLEENPDGSMKYAFDCDNRIIKRNGRRTAFFWPEDWKFSRQLREAGLRIAATQVVEIVHEGQFSYSNREAGDWTEDLVNGPNGEWRKTIEIDAS